MPVTIHSAPKSDLTEAEIERWRAIPVAVAVDLGRNLNQIDPAIRPLMPPGRQPRLFGRAVTAFCEAPDFGSVVRVMDVIGPGDVLVIAAAGHSESAMIGEILGAISAARAPSAWSVTERSAMSGHSPAGRILQSSRAL